MIEEGRLMLQLCFVAMAEAESLYDARAWPPRVASDEDRAEYERLRAVAAAYGYRAHALGFHGGGDEAFNFYAGLPDPAPIDWEALV